MPSSFMWFLSFLGSRRGARELMPLGYGGDERVDDLAELLAEISVHQRTVLVESRRRVADSEFGVDDTGADCAQNLAELGLGPDRAEGARRGTHHDCGLVPERVRGEWPRDPVERVLQMTRNGAVVLGGGDEEGVGARESRAQGTHGLRGAVAIVVLVIRRDVLQP